MNQKISQWIGDYSDLLDPVDKEKYEITSSAIPDANYIRETNILSEQFMFLTFV